MKSCRVPFAREHRARQRSPEELGEIRRVKPEGYPAGVEAVVGFRDDGGSEVQTVVFDADEWAPDRAREWLHQRGMVVDLDVADEERGDVRFDDLPSDGLPVREVRRWDFAPLEKPRRTSEGFVRAQGHITRAGVFEYVRRDGTVVRELRSPAEVFKTDSLTSFSLVPLTLGHPPDNLTPDTARDFSVGAVGTPERNGDLVRADVLITRADAIQAVMAGRNKLSCGYTCKLLERRGVYRDSQGLTHSFDAVQTEILGNHVALCDNPRAGPEAQLRVDARDAFADLSEGTEGSDMDEEVWIRGVQVTVKADEAKRLREAGLLDEGPPKAKPTADTDPTATALAEAIAARDEARGQLKAMKAKQDETESRDREAAEKDGAKRATKDRIGLLAQAQKFMPDRKLDDLLELDDSELMREVIKHDGAVVLSGKESEAEVRGVYKHIISSRVNTPEAIRTMVNGARGRDQETRTDGYDEAVAARRRMLERDSNAWKPKELRKKD